MSILKSVSGKGSETRALTGEAANSVDHVVLAHTKSCVLTWRLCQPNLQSVHHLEQELATTAMFIHLCL